MVELTVTEGRWSHPDGGHTWYRRTTPRTPAAGALPLVVLHGGPGMSHDYLRRLGELAQQGREVIHYDQVGCGRSSHHPEAPAGHWSVDLFVTELAGLIEHWGVGGGFHLLGHSWGGMLAPEYVLRHPEGVVSMSLLDSPASMPGWVDATRGRLQDMPAAVRDVIARHEAAGTYDDPEYAGAVEDFYAEYLCRVRPWPQDLRDSLAALDQDPTVYSTMIGPSEFTITGSLADWSVAERVAGITVPSLVGYGELDEAGDSWRPFADHLPDVTVHRFRGASHTPHLETPDEFDRVVGDFLGRHDRHDRSA